MHVQLDKKNKGYKLLCSCCNVTDLSVYIHMYIHYVVVSNKYVFDIVLYFVFLAFYVISRVAF